MGALVLVGLVVGIVVGRCNLSDAGVEGHLERGLAALARATRGDHAAFEVAEVSFAKASGGSVFDAYPLFMLELTRALREGRAAASDPAVRAVVVALARGDFDAALAALPSIPEGFPGRHHLERATVELARRAPAPP